MPKPLSSGKKSAALQQLLGRAMSLHQLGHLSEAEQLYLQILQTKPALPEAQHLLGVLRGQQGRFEEALKLVGTALKAQPNSPVILSDHGLVLFKLGQHEEALAAFEKALAIGPDHAPSLSNRGNVLSELGRFDEALASYDRALRIRPDYPEALHNRGNALSALRRHEEALASYDKVLSIRGPDPAALTSRGNVLAALGRHTEALASYDKALATNSGHADALYQRGNTLAVLRRYEEALRDYDRALAIRPGHAEAHDNRGNALAALKQFDQAIFSYDRALALRPDYLGALNNRGIALKALKRYQEALADFDRVLAVSPELADAHYNRANVLKEMRSYEEALAAYQKARLTDPNHPDAFGLIDVVTSLCDWALVAPLADELATQIAAGKAIVPPFAVLGLYDDPALLLTCARNYVKDRIPLGFDASWDGAAFRNEKIRIAYLSADFREHATAYLTAELFEAHDRSRFEVLGFSFGRDDGSDMRRRLAQAFDQFHDVQNASDRTIAGLLRDLRIDIAIDLKGYTQDSRPEIFALRPAPIQVNYLGFPGTMGAEFIDYVIADKIILPFEQQPFYTEKIVHLPDCYQANDSKRVIAARSPSRLEAGLPQDGLVFCCFNNNYKITRPVFDVWMRLLEAVGDSVLWLLRDNAGAQENLRRAAQERGIAPTRLVFAERAKLGEHLERHSLADLFLDTLPYNAHTTASDALWAGVPVLTCQGKAFAGRVAASLLRAVGLPELVTHTLNEYEALARNLAADRPRLAAMREKLARNKLICPLFDVDRFRRHIESAFSTMWGIRQSGENPRAFSVESTEN